VDEGWVQCEFNRWKDGLSPKVGRVVDKCGKDENGGMIAYAFGWAEGKYLCKLRGWCGDEEIPSRWRPDRDTQWSNDFLVYITILPILLIAFLVQIPWDIFNR